MIYLFLAPGFEEIEAVAVVDILRRAELPITTVGVPELAVRGAHGMVLVADKAVSEVAGEEAEMVILPGGMPGTLNLEKSGVVCRMVRRCMENGRVSAICAAPSILGHMGLLKGRKAVCFPGFERELKGAQVAAGPVCCDGNLITANGPGSAVLFALEIVAQLCGTEKAEALKAGMQC